MRFLHLADLHLGKQMNDLSLLEDQEYILGQISELAQRERVEAVLIAGDVYQRSSPQAEAMALFDAFVSGLAARGMRVYVISGNHDSAERISYLGSLIRPAGVYVTEAFEGTLQHETLRDPDGEIDIWMMPFLRPAQVKRWLPEERITTYQEAVEAVLRGAEIHPDRRNVLLCHQFITGSERCGSEEMAVGGLDQIDGSILEAFDYVALGHIHKAQRVGRETVRYAGSPLKYAFSEANDRKSVTIVDLGAKGDTQVRTLPLTPLRDVRVLEGRMEELMRQPYSEDYVWITIHDELVPPDARVTLSVNFPNLLKFSIANSRTKESVDVLAQERLENRTVTELFEDFYRFQNHDQPLGAAHRKTLEKVLRELEEEA